MPSLIFQASGATDAMQMYARSDALGSRRVHEYMAIQRMCPREHCLYRIFLYHSIQGLLYCGIQGQRDLTAHINGARIYSHECQQHLQNSQRK